MADKLREAAQALVDRWDSPAWGGSAGNLRHTGEYIAALRAALDQPVQKSTLSSDHCLWKRNGHDTCSLAKMVDAQQPAVPPSYKLLERMALDHECKAEELEARDVDGECLVAADFHATRASEIRAMLNAAPAAQKEQP